MRRAGCMTDPPTAPLCSLAGRGGERGRKYWILTVRENIAIKLNLLSSLINFKYRLDLTLTTSGRCLTPTVKSQKWQSGSTSSSGGGTLHSHGTLTTADWTLGPSDHFNSFYQNKNLHCRKETGCLHSLDSPSFYDGLYIL